MEKPGLTQQEKYNLYLAHLRGETRAETVNLENPQVPLDGFTLAEVFGGARPSLSGIMITPENALKLSAVWRCVAILSGIFSYLPSKPFHDLTNGGRTPAKDHPTYKLFTRRPSPLYTKSVYWERSMIHMLLRGNHYAEIILNGAGEITRFDLIIPQQIKSITFSRGKLWYDIQGREDLVPGERMIHVPHLGEDPISGKSTITYAREDLGMEVARRDTGAKFWLDGGNPTTLLTTSQRLQPTQEAQLKESFRNKKREGGTVVAPFGADVKVISMSPADQEFIMSGNFSVAAICRWFGVPLHKLSELERATMNNIEHQAIEFLQDTMAPIVQKFEDEYTTKCFSLPEEDDLLLLFDMKAYQRADSVAIAQRNQSAIQNGWMTPNEVRQEDNRPAMDGGDDLYLQLNMQRLADVAKNAAIKKTAPQPPVNVKSSREALKRNVTELLELMEVEDKITNGNGKH